MAMKFSSSGDGEVLVDMNTTPLIDVMLVMLVMLIVTIPLQMHAVKLNMPQTPTQHAPPPVVNLAIDFDGTITWNGTPVSMDQLDAYFVQEAAKGDAQDEIHVNPNRLAKYDTVAKVLADAQRRNVKSIGIGNSSEYLH
jgi:biopolymer transport protein ExbD